MSRAAFNDLSMILADPGKALGFTHCPLLMYCTGERFAQAVPASPCELGISVDFYELKLSCLPESRCKFDDLRRTKYELDSDGPDK